MDKIENPPPIEKNNLTKPFMLLRDNNFKEIVFDINEKIPVMVVSKGWFENQVIAKAKDRCITILDCNADINNKINVKIIENKNNIYIAQLK